MQHRYLIFRVIRSWRVWLLAVQAPGLAGSTLQLQCDARSVELIVANYVIRTPHPTQERCDQTTALLDA